MDATQRLDYDEEEEPSLNRERPVGNLHMFAGIHGPAQDFPIYHGQNLIGRHASCDITLPAQSVSKKHAILEVRGDCHTICDNGSLNKTRRGKAALSPHIRYALSGGDFLLFADVACRYTVENVETETTGVEESEDDSVLVPATQGALAIEKTPGAAIRRIARGAVLARDSGDEDEEEEGQTRRNEGGCGSFKDGHKTSGTGAILPPDADTIVPESDEENDTSTSETRLPSLNLPCDSDTDTSRRSSFVPSSQNISTPVVLLKDQSRLGGRTLTAVDKEEMEPKKQTDAEMRLRLTVEHPTDDKENQKEEQAVESTSGGSVSEPCGELVGTADHKMKKEEDDVLKKSSSESVSVSSPCGEDNLTSSRSDIVQEAPCESNPKGDLLMQNNNEKISETDVKVKEDNLSLDGESNVHEKDTTTSGIDVNTEEAAELQNKKAEEGNEGALGLSGAAFHMDSDTDVDEDEAATTGSDLEKAESHQVTKITESEDNASASVIGGNEEDIDSDTDVEGDPNVLQSKGDEVSKMMGELSNTEGPAALGIDSDTDDADLPKPAKNHAEQDSRSNNEEKREDFHLDSDTDVEEDASTAEVKEAEPESSEVSRKETKDAFNLDSDTDVDEDVDDSSKDVTHGPQDSSTASTNVQETTGVDSDNDVSEDDQIPGGSNVALEKTSADEEPKDKMAVSDVLVAKEATALHTDSDTDVDDNVAPESTTHSDGAKMGTEVTNAVELHLDSDTDVEEDDEGKEDTSVQEESCVDEKPSVSSSSEADPVSGISTEQTKNIPTEISMEDDETQKSESESVDLDMMPTQCYLESQEESELQDEEEATQAFILSSTWAEPDPFKRPADPIGVLQISSVTLDASEDDIDENAIAETQAFCTDTEPRGPSVLDTPEPVRIRVDETIESSSSREESEKEAQQLFHEHLSQDATQPISQDSSARPPQEAGTWLHLKREVPASVWIRGIQQEGDSRDMEGGKEAAEDATQADEPSLKLELEATQSYIVESSSLLKPPVQTETPAVPAAEESHAETDVPSEDIEQPCSEDTQASENDATQPDALAVPGLDNGSKQASNVSEKTIDDGGTQTVDMHTVAKEDANTQVATLGDGATEADSIHTVAVEDDNTQVVTSGDGATEVESIHTVAVEEDDTQVVTPGDGATEAEGIHTVATEDDNTQVVTVGDDATQAGSIHAVSTEDDATQVVPPSDLAVEVVVPETSTKGKEKLSSRRGLSRSKKKEEPAQNVPTSSITEEPMDKASTGPDSLREEPDEQSTGKPQLPELEIKEHVVKASAGPGSIREESDEQNAGKPQVSEPEVKEVEKEVRRRGGRKIVESQAITTAKDEVPAATTSRKRTSKTTSSEAKPSTSGVGEQRGRKQVSRKSTIKVLNEELKEEHEKSSSKTEEDEESSAPEILPVNPSEEIETLTKEDDKKGNVEDQTSKQILCTEASTSSTVIESEERVEANDNSAEKEPESHQNKKPARNKRRAATRLKNEAETSDVEKNKDEIIDHNLATSEQKNAIKQTPESLQSRLITQEENQGRKPTRKSRAKSLEESDKNENTTVVERKKAGEVSAAEQVPGNEKSRRTRRSLKEEVKEESENLQERKRKTSRITSVKDAEPTTEEKGNEDVPESNKRSKRTRSNSKEDTTKQGQEMKEDVKMEENEVIKKPKRTQKNMKEEQKPEDNIETQEISSSDAQTSRRTRRECRGEDKTVKEETVKESTSRRTRKQSKEEEAVKLDEEQTKKSRRTRKDSKEETKTEESFVEEDKEETVGRKSTRRTRRNIKEDKTSVDEKETKQTEGNTKSERSSRTRAKTSDESRELHEEMGVNKGTESQKLSPQEETSKPTGGRGRRAAKKEDIPQVSTPVASRKRGQATKAEVEEKRKKADGEEQEVLGEVETPKSRRGRPRKRDTENTQSLKEVSPLVPSPSTRKRSSSALNNPPEARTPRRTNRMSTAATATSPYVAQSGSAPKILFTGVVDTAGEEAIRALGGEIAESVFDCTHLVTDRVRRTVKFLCALARGIPIVTLDWIEKCKKRKCFLSPAGFLVNDKEQEKNFNFLLSESLQKAKKRPLFEGYEIHVTANVKPEPEHMKDIIRCSGANFLPKMPRSFKEKCVIVSCPEDSTRCKSVPASVPITSAEFLLSGILRQEVNPTAYLLNPADTVPTPAKRRR